MKHTWSALLTVGLPCMTVVALSAQKPPVFRTRADLVQMDVTVFDKSGQPVRGLARNDFTLREDDVLQAIEGFSAVDVADVVHEGPAWSHTTAPDVTTNEILSQRIFVLVIDDALGMGMRETVPSGPDLWAVRRMKESVAQFISQLAPADQVALVFTQRTRLSQNLTNDHARLLKAVQAFPDAGGGDMGLGACGNRAPITTMMSAIKELANVTDRRKAIVYFGGELPWYMQPDRCGIYWDWRDLFAAAQQAHVTISPVDTMGLRLRGMRDEYLTVAEHTGGRAILNTNDFGPGLRRIFVENSSYYLLAYQPTRAIEDGTFRRISVTVNGRPDLQVSARRNYWAPKSRKATDPPPPPPPDVESLAGIIPLSKLALRVTAAPFAAPGGQSAVVAIALGVKQPAFAARTPEQVELLIKAYTADGDERGSDSQTIPITVPAARTDSDVTRYEVLARIELPKPGKYELRLSAHSAAADTRGSVYVDVEVPDFRKERLSLSGVVLTSALPSTPVAPTRLLRDIVSIVPTSERAFLSSDVITMLMRVYQGGNDGLVPVPLTIRIQDASGKSVFARSDSVAIDRFTSDRASDYQLRLPLTQLATGRYLLSVEATAGKVKAKRDVQFEVR